MTLKYWSILLIGLWTQSVCAQKLEQFSVSATSEAIGLPFTNYAPYHPGAEFSVTFEENEKEKSIRYLNAKAGFFYHRRLETAIYLGGEYQYSYKLLKDQLTVDAPMGIGYLHSFYPGELYEQNGDGDFENVSQLGRPHFYLNLGIGFTYIGSEKVQPFIRQSFLLETPFANGIPVIPHSLIQFGVQIKLRNNETN